jgi:acetyl esterase/lipase
MKLTTMPMSKIVLLMFVLSACSAPLRTEKVSDERLFGEEKTLVLLTGTEFDPDIRRALIRNGFRVKKFATVIKVEQSTSNETKETFKKAEAKFGLSVYAGRIVDRCVINEAVQIGRAVFEVSNLSTNEVILYVEGGGWTSPCAYHQDLVWDKLAQALAREWK